MKILAIVFAGFLGSISAFAGPSSFLDCFQAIQQEGANAYGSEIGFYEVAGTRIGLGGELSNSSSVTANGTLVIALNYGRFRKTDIRFECRKNQPQVTVIEQGTQVIGGGAWFNTQLIGTRTELSKTVPMLVSMMNREGRSFDGFETLAVAFGSSDADYPRWVGTYTRKPSLTSWRSYPESVFIDDQPNPMSGSPIYFKKIRSN